MKCLLICDKTEYSRNNWFTNELLSKLKDEFKNATLCFSNDVMTSEKNGQINVEINGKPLADYDFVVNRSRLYMIAKAIELKGIKVFNSAQFTEISNDKIKTFLEVSRASRCVTPESYFCNKKLFNVEKFLNVFPCVVKEPKNYGGYGVFFAENRVEFNQVLKLIKTESFILQKEIPLEEYADLRVYVVGGKIISAIRKKPVMVKTSLYSKQYEAMLCEIDANVTKIVNEICGALKPDFAGIDFLIGKDGITYFNEIEDVVGSANFFKLSNINIADIFVKYIKKIIEKGDKTNAN